MYTGKQSVDNVVLGKTDRRKTVVRQYWDSTVTSDESTLHSDARLFARARAPTAVISFYRSASGIRKNASTRQTWGKSCIITVPVVPTMSDTEHGARQSQNYINIPNPNPHPPHHTTPHSPSQDHHPHHSPAAKNSTPDRSTYVGTRLGA